MDAIHICEQLSSLCSSPLAREWRSCTLTITSSSPLSPSDRRFLGNRRPNLSSTQMSASRSVYLALGINIDNLDSRLRQPSSRLRLHSYTALAFFRVNCCRRALLLHANPFSYDPSVYNIIYGFSPLFFFTNILAIFWSRGYQRGKQSLVLI